ncbi:MAG: hypothetical protein J2O48_02335, partial [Solirubrobacterales bacterium]|nr:hypothetical protein [Solirubrobacterales bacterium]
MTVKDAGIGGSAAGTEAESLEFSTSRTCRVQNAPRLAAYAGAKQIAHETSQAGAHRTIVLASGSPRYADLLYADNTGAIPHCKPVKITAFKAALPGIGAPLSGRLGSSITVCANDPGPRQDAGLGTRSQDGPV